LALYHMPLQWFYNNLMRDKVPFKLGTLRALVIGVAMDGDEKIKDDNLGCQEGSQDFRKKTYARMRGEVWQEETKVEVECR